MSQDRSAAVRSASKPLPRSGRACAPDLAFSWPAGLGAPAMAWRSCSLGLASAWHALALCLDPALCVLTLGLDPGGHALVLGLALAIGSPVAIAGEPSPPEAEVAPLPPLPAAPRILFTAERFEVAGENPLSAADTSALLAPHLGPQEGLNGLLAAADALSRALRERGYPFHRAIVPPQTVEGGTIRLEVVRARLARVTVQGNAHFGEANIRRAAAGLADGETPDVALLTRSLSLANQHPSKQAVLTFREAETPEQVEAVLEVNDRQPVTFFASLNNVGTPLVDEGNNRTSGTERSRLTVGGQHTNLFDLDHIITATYTTSPEHVQEVEQVGLNYRIPFYAWSSTLTASHSRSDVDSGTLPGGAFPDAIVTGAGRFTGLTWGYFLPNIGAFRHGLGLSIEDKFFLSQITGADFTLGDVRSRPVTLRYDAGRRGTWWSAAAGIAYSHNLAGGADNDTRAYEESRQRGVRPGLPGLPRPTWDALRVNANAIVVLPRQWEIRSIFEGQWADQALIAGERFGVGGFASVRGFEERAATGDSGARLTLEIWAPPLPGNVRAFWFSDAGFITLAEPMTGELASDTLVSSGLGLRWAAADRLALQLDYGHELEGVEMAGLGGFKTHFMITYRY